MIPARPWRALRSQPCPSFFHDPLRTLIAIFFVGETEEVVLCEMGVFVLNVLAGGKVQDSDLRWPIKLRLV